MAEIRGIEVLTRAVTAFEEPSVDDCMVVVSDRFAENGGTMATDARDYWPTPWVINPWCVHTRATGPTSSTVSQTNMLLRRRRLDEKVRSLSPERRALFEEIKRLRDRIGPIDFDVVRAIRELRENG